MAAQACLPRATRDTQSGCTAPPTTTTSSCWRRAGCTELQVRGAGGQRGTWFGCSGSSAEALNSAGWRCLTVQLCAARLAPACPVVSAAAAAVHPAGLLALCFARWRCASHACSVCRTPRRQLNLPVQRIPALAGGGWAQGPPWNVGRRSQPLHQLGLAVCACRCQPAAVSAAVHLAASRTWVGLLVLAAVLLLLPDNRSYSRSPGTPPLPRRCAILP